MPTHRTSLLFATAGFALLCAGSARADAALETPIATAALQHVAWVVTDESHNATRPYPEHFRQTGRPIDCRGELTVGARKGYLYRHHGLDVANGEPTSQASGTATCGDVSLEVGGSVLLGDGRDGIPTGMELRTATGTGSERLANEAWVVLSYHPTIDTPLGRFNIEAAVVYRATDNGQGVFSTRDDYTELVARLGYPLTFGSLTVEPYIRSTKANPVGYNNSLYWMAEGVKVDWQVSDDLSLNLDVLCDHNVNSVTAVIHRNVCYGTTSMRRAFRDSRWSMQVGVQFSQYADYDRNFDFVVERDGRLLKSRDTQKTEAGFELYPFMTFTRAF